MPDLQHQKRIVTAERLKIPVEKIPFHIGIVMDGNGRWAKKRMMPRFLGHREGGKNVEPIVLGANDLGIGCLSLYSFSLQNWKRPAMEVDFLMHLFTRYLVSMRKLMLDNNIRLRHLGRREGLPDTLRFEMDKTIEMTGDNTGMVLALALNYGGREEIADAVARIAEDIENGSMKASDINEQAIADRLYTSGIPDPDMVVRTSNELRISNFLLWQVSYSEFYLTDTLWPDFRVKELEQAVCEYASRSRRMGDVKPSK
jgi:undecaprenyl diphosphate synthase